MSVYNMIYQFIRANKTVQKNEEYKNEEMRK